MEGRWTIWPGFKLSPDDEEICSVVDGPCVPPGQSVPVVPCDDAAIKRAVGAAMDAIVESEDVIPPGQEPQMDGWALALAVRAIRAGFKAAGETP